MQTTLVEVIPGATLELSLVYFGTVFGRADVRRFGNWHGHSWRAEDRSPSDALVQEAASRAAGRELTLWDWDVRRDGLLTFRFEPKGEEPAPPESWHAKECAAVKQEMRLEDDPPSDPEPVTEAEARQVYQREWEHLQSLKKQAKAQQELVAVAKGRLSRLEAEGRRTEGDDDCPLFRDLPATSQGAG
jgi:hypothetical protein